MPNLNSATLHPLEEFCENLGATFLGNLEDILIFNLSTYLESNGVSNANLRALGLGETPSGEDRVKSPFPITGNKKVAVSPKTNKRKKKKEKVERVEEVGVIDMVEGKDGVWG